ncbi:hypothetical protein [Candidatus Poriferisodalis sp.]|uniref:hypothetical protein n=1 Tax=Candidatus Poriferisodalis sp. TaxID=3101277 RepID=UPI003C6F112B
MECSGGDGPLGSDAVVPGAGSGRHYEMVSADGFHSCALLDDGAAKCWGNNRFGQAPADRSHNDTNLGYVSVDAGVWHTCAVVDDGSLDYWGRNDDGQLDAPALEGGREWIQASAGGYLGGISTNGALSHSRTCGLVIDGTVRCWGDTPHGLDEVPHAKHGHTWVEDSNFELSRTPGRPLWGGPMFGEHNMEVLEGILGYNADKVAELVIAGAIT